MALAAACAVQLMGRDYVEVLIKLPYNKAEINHPDDLSRLRHGKTRWQTTGETYPCRVPQ